MIKSLTVKPTIRLLVVLTSLVLTACNAQPSDALVQTAVAETLTAAPVLPAGEIQELEVTRLVEVTRIVQVQITNTPEPTQEVTATPTSEPTATTTLTPTPGSAFTTGMTEAEPTSTIVPSGPLGLSLNQLINRYAAMTDLQKQDFAVTLPGKTVYWTAQVYNITTDGTLIMDNPYGAGRVMLIGVPLETAIRIDKDMLVDFRGMIVSFAGTFGREIVVANPEVVRYYVEATATP
jgi:hypothetical protein